MIAGHFLDIIFERIGHVATEDVELIGRELCDAFGWKLEILRENLWRGVSDPIRNEEGAFFGK